MRRSDAWKERDPVPEDLDTILRRVASGELTPEAAEPLVAAAGQNSGAAAGDIAGDVPRLDSPRTDTPATDAPPPHDTRGFPAATASPGAQRTVRLQVLENGKPVVNLRIPMSWASLAGSVVPGISGPHAERLRDAIRRGEVGTILEVQDEDGDGVIISTE